MVMWDSCHIGYQLSRQFSPQCSDPAQSLQLPSSEVKLYCGKQVKYGIIILLFHGDLNKGHFPKHPC